MAALTPKARASLRATLVEPGLLRTKGLIDGKWLSAASGKTFAVTDPATDTEVASVASFGEADAKLAVSAAEQSFDAWRSKTMQVTFDDVREVFPLMWHVCFVRERNVYSSSWRVDRPNSPAGNEGKKYSTASYMHGFMDTYADERQRQIHL